MISLLDKTGNTRKNGLGIQKRKKGRGAQECEKKKVKDQKYVEENISCRVRIPRNR